MKKSVGVSLGVAVTVAALAVGSLVLWHRWSHVDTVPLSPTSSSVSTAQETSTSSPPSREAVAQAPATIGGALPTSPGVTLPDASRLFFAMNSASDLRVFAEAAKREPGGYLYAIRAVDECRILREALLSTKPAASVQTQAALDPRMQAQADAIAWLSRRCEGFTSAELGASEQRFLVQTAKERDHLYILLARAQASQTTDSADREASLRAALQSKDPTLINTVAWSMAQPASSGGSSVVFVDGRPFGGLDASAYAAAWSLAACSVTGTCGLKDSQVAHFCAFEGKCAQDVASLALADFQRPDEIAKVRALAEKLESIITVGDIGRLRPPLKK
jgi:hypothetical protein